MASNERESRIGGRDARTGHFIPVKETYERPNTTVRERIPLPGHGDTGRSHPKPAPTKKDYLTR